MKHDVSNVKHENEVGGTLHLEVTMPSTQQPRYREKSSLGSLLDEYHTDGSPEPVQIHDPKKKKKKKGSPVKGVTRENTFERQDREDRNQAKRERYMKVYDDVHRLRDYCYDDYLGQLQDKVELQRRKIKQKSLEMEENLNRERVKSTKKVPQRQDLTHDDQFLKHLPKSDYYKIIALEKKMISEGKLSSHSQRDQFWTDIRKPEVFRRHFPPSRLSPLQVCSDVSPARSHTSSMSSAYPGEPDEIKELPRPLTQIEEIKESSRPVTQDGPITHRKVLDPHTLAKLAAADAERRCPQLQLPKMSCFSDDGQKNSEDEELTAAELEAERRDKERRLFVKRLRRMYELSLSNKASTQRMMDLHHSDLSEINEGPTLSQLLAVPELLAGPQKEQDRKDVEEKDARPWMRHIRGKHRSIMPIQEECEDTPTSSYATPTEPLTPPTPEHEQSVVLPLDLDELSNKSVVMESKSMSTLWPNYTRALMPVVRI